MKATAVILDGYVDEPACLGVPPYISPYIRTAAGVLLEHGYSVHYATIDQLRSDPSRINALNASDCVLMVAGVTVPGKYLGGTPATLSEIRQIGAAVRAKKKLVGGPIAFGYSPEGGQAAVKQAIAGFDAMLSGSVAEALDEYLRGNGPAGTLDYSRSDAWSVAGSGIIREHPGFPHVICELETARGCPHGAYGGCSFCTEPFYGKPEYRGIPGIAAEVAALSAQGARHFRVGRQPDILAYGAGGGEYPAPEPETVDALFAAIRNAAPGLETLHIDNVSPATVARHEDAAREALSAIVRHHTPGDVAAFGMETADPAVVAANNLKAGPDEVFRAIEIVNEAGGMRRGGVPDLLPGLNFVCGLAGETEETYDRNERFLTRVLAANLLVRRVNIRQLMPFPGTPAYHNNTLGKHERRFRAFKDRARKHFDLPMLRKVFPAGTVLRSVIVEKAGDISFGRQMGSYPILAGIPVQIPARTVLDAAVVDWGMRSVTALPVPIRINELPASALKWLPGIPKKNVARIIAKRPFATLDEFRKVAENTLPDTLFAV